MQVINTKKHLPDWQTLLCQQALNFYPQKKCNDFISFTDKIQKIKQAVTSTISGIGSVLSLHPLKTNSLAWQNLILSTT